MELKRLEVKYIRDYCKAEYNKGTECFICGTNENLQFHHFYSLTLLWEKYKKENNIKITSIVDINNYRDKFREDHIRELFDEAVTLCDYHHNTKLHGIYGKAPPLSTAEKQKRWCQLQRDKYYNGGNK